MIETKFKQTEIGLIPEDWKVFSVGEDCIVKARIGWQGLKTSEYLFSGEFGLITSTDIVDGDINWKTCFFVNKERYLQDANIIVRNGDILVSKDGTIGKVGIVSNMPFPSTLNSGIFVIRTANSNIQQNGLTLAFVSSYFKSFIKRLTAGSTIVHLYQKDIVEFKFPLPSQKTEQEKIFQTLLNADKLISSLSKLIEKKRLIKQGAMQQLLTGEKRLPGFDGEWVKVYLGNIADIRTGKRNGDEATPTGKYCFFVRSQDVFRIDDYSYDGEAILIPGEGGIGTIFHYINGKFDYHQRVYKISDFSKDFCCRFIYYYLQQYFGAWAQMLTVKATVDSLRLDTFKNFRMYIPNTYNEQSAIANILTTMDNEIESLVEERDKYIQVKEGMMQKLLTGQIRLVEAEAKQQDHPKAKAANVYFKRSVLAAEIADRLCEERTFGHVKMEKLIFLTEHLCHIDIDSHYHRDAAGPYDNRALRSIDSQMKKQKWFEAKKEDKGYRYLPMQNRGGHKKYFEKYYSDVMPMFEKIIETFKTSSTEQCEIVATLYSAWDDLLQSRQPFTDDDILNEVLNNWNETKKRIKRSRWQAALDWMRANGFVPQNDNR